MPDAPRSVGLGVVCRAQGRATRGLENPLDSWDLGAPGFAIGAGFGMSGEFNYEEPFACLDEGACTPAKWSFAPFAQGELYLEGRTGLGFSVRGYFGMWRLLDTTPDVCPDTCTPTETVSAPYFGVALGGAL